MGKFVALSERYNNYLNDLSGNFALIFAIGASAILLSASAAVEITGMYSEKSKVQDIADAAVLSAAKNFADNIKLVKTENDFNKYKSKARKAGEAALKGFPDLDRFTDLDAKFNFTSSSVSLNINLVAETTMMKTFGYDDYTINVDTMANLPMSQPNDIDIVLITDASGSMATQIQAVQDNMRNLPTDLANELNSAGISIGTIRAKFIFFRDYGFDNVSIVTSRTDAPPNSFDGAMYESAFYELPDETPAMESYVDQFAAYGGGDTPESGIEALIHAVDADDWGAGATTIRSVILWTDAPTKIIHEFDPPDENLSDEWWFDNSEWAERISPEFATLDLPARAQRMYDNFYPITEIPTSMNEVREKFETFHAENTNGASDIVTFKINVSDICTDETGLGVCDSWSTIGSWDGIEVNHESASLTSSDTYWETIRDIADAARTQVSARDLALAK